jgi:hypothetical protein
MNKFILLCALLVITGCTPRAGQLDFSVLPDELKDCKFFYLRDGSGNNITVARCPNSATSVVSGGKQKRTSITAEGEK